MFPFIVGEGINTVTELLEQDPRFAHFQDKFDEFDSLYIPNIGEIVRLKCTGSAKDGCIHKSWPLSVEDPLWEKIKNISQDLPEFWVGRYDVKFKDLKGLILRQFE